MLDTLRKARVSSPRRASLLLENCLFRTGPDRQPQSFGKPKHAIQRGSQSSGPIQLVLLPLLKVVLGKRWCGVGRRNENENETKAEAGNVPLHARQRNKTGMKTCEACMCPSSQPLTVYNHCQNGKFITSWVDRAPSRNMLQRWFSSHGPFFCPSANLHYHDLLLSSR